MHRSRLAIVSVAAASLFAVACGSDSKSAATTTTITTSTSAGSAVTDAGGGSTPDTGGTTTSTSPTASTSVSPTQVIGTTTVPTASTAPGGTSVTDGPGVTPPPPSGPDDSAVATTIGDGTDPLSAYCVSFQAYKDAERKVNAAFSGDVDPATAAPLIGALDSTMSAFEQSAASSTVGADVTAVAKPRHDLIDIIVELNYDLNAVETDERAVALRDAFSTAEMVASGNRVNAYTVATCGIDDEF